MDIDIRVVGPGDRHLLSQVAPDVFDSAIVDRWLGEFLADPRHHLVVAVDGGAVVGMASAVHYVHPDKAPELWINEVGVASAHRGGGIGKALVRRLLEVGRGLGCTEAWVLTDARNAAAMRVYADCGGKRAEDDQIMYQFPLG